ncbi:MAG: 2-dehydropantoate 2-reductase N-terminal domain-containing protein, partial [Gaiellaceae bacterium]
MIGAGAIGSLVAAHLAQIVPVVVLTRREEHALALRRHGLRVSGLSELSVEVEATSHPGRLPEFAIGILATKATEVESAARALEGRFEEAVMVTIQNGLGA